MKNRVQARARLDVRTRMSYSEYVRDFYYYGGSGSILDILRVRREQNHLPGSLQFQFQCAGLPRHSIKHIFASHWPNF
jgi:hypothetical protein